MCRNHPPPDMKVFDTVARFRIYTFISRPPSQKELPWCCFYSCYTGLQNCPALCTLHVFQIVLVMSETRLIFCVTWKIALRLDVWKQPICWAERRGHVYKTNHSFTTYFMLKKYIWSQIAFFVAIQFYNKFSPSVQSAPKLTSFCPFFSPSSSSLRIHRAIILHLFLF